MWRALQPQYSQLFTLYVVHAGAGQFGLTPGFFLLLRCENPGLPAPDALLLLINRTPALNGWFDSLKERDELIGQSQCPEIRLRQAARLPATDVRSSR
ncbi:MAG TPA: hypothetical protein VFA04_16965 [Bryobacteraceae bacterium]|nr:hypothetical protein [Bryobacteraceae bacterium]